MAYSTTRDCYWVYPPFSRAPLHCKRGREFAFFHAAHFAGIGWRRVWSHLSTSAGLNNLNSVTAFCPLVVGPWGASRLCSRGTKHCSRTSVHYSWSLPHFYTTTIYYYSSLSELHEPTLSPQSLSETLLHFDSR